MSMVFNFYENNKLKMTLSLAEMEADNDAGQDGIALIAEFSKLTLGERFAWGGGAEPLYEAVAVWQDIPICDDVRCTLRSDHAGPCETRSIDDVKRSLLEPDDDEDDEDEDEEDILPCFACGRGNGVHGVGCFA